MALQVFEASKPPLAASTQEAFWLYDNVVEGVAGGGHLRSVDTVCAEKRGKLEGDLVTGAGLCGASNMHGKYSKLERARFT
jgi:hypothetical protein